MKPFFSSLKKYIGSLNVCGCETVSVSVMKNKLLNCCAVYLDPTQGKVQRTAGCYVTDGQLHILYCMANLQIIFS